MIRPSCAIEALSPLRPTNHVLTEGKGNTYGLRMHPNDRRDASSFNVQASKCEQTTIYGEGKQARSFCYTDHLSDGFLCMIDTEACFTGPVNMGNPDEFTMHELAEEVIELAECSALILRLLPADDLMQRQLDVSLARQRLGWEPKVLLKDGLLHTNACFDELLTGPQ